MTSKLDIILDVLNRVRVDTEGGGLDWQRYNSSAFVLDQGHGQLMIQKVDNKLALMAEHFSALPTPVFIFAARDQGGVERFNASSHLGADIHLQLKELYSFLDFQEVEKGAGFVDHVLGRS